MNDNRNTQGKDQKIGGQKDKQQQGGRNNPQGRDEKQGNQGQQKGNQGGQQGEQNQANRGGDRDQR